MADDDRTISYTSDADDEDSDHKLHGVFELHQDKVKKRNNTIRIVVWILLAILIVLLLVTVIALASVLGVKIKKSKIAARTKSQANQSVCLTSACIQATAYIEAVLDQSVDPCDDFYKFSCGTWLNENIVPSGKKQLRLGLGKIAEKNNVVLRKILESKDDGGVTAVRKAIDYYTSCLNTTEIESQGAKPLQQLINETGGWNLTDRSDGWSFNDPQFIKEKLMKSNAFFSYDISFDLKNASRYIILLSQDGLTLKQGNYNDTEIVEVLKSEIKNTLALIQPNVTEEDTDYVASGIVRVETLLDSIFPDTQGKEVYYTIDDLQTLTGPEFQWMNFIQELAKFGGINNVDAIQPLQVHAQSYFKAVFRAMQSQNISATDLRNYARWRFISTFVNYLTAESDTDRRRSICLHNTGQIFSIALTRPFAEKTYLRHIKKPVSKMISSITNAFKKEVTDINWLDDHSRKAVLEKVDAIESVIAYPHGLFNNTYLNALYANYNIKSNSYFDNERHIITASEKRKLSHLGQTINRTVWPWHQNPLEINAKNLILLNQLVFFSGYIQTPLFNADWPSYLKYGKLGMTIGHEIIHGFDNSGQQRDKYGIEQQTWSNHSLQEFKKRHKCFVDQYSEYILDKFPNFKNDGEHTLGENIADNGGLRAAFKAYQNIKRKGVPVQTLPSLPYTDEQLFFISFGQSWCIMYDKPPSAADVHSPDPFRIWGALQNSDDFAKVFNCRKGSFMNPLPSVHKKCHLW